MRNLVIAMLSALVVSLAPAPAVAQCGGQGDLVLELQSVGGTGTVPGSELTIRVIGKPGQHVCFACTPEQGPTILPGLGTVCLALGGPLQEVVFFLPASGVVEATVELPAGAVGAQLCCTALGLDPSLPTGLAISNSSCFSIEPNCDSGGVLEVGYVTKISDVTSFPVNVQTSVKGRAGGGGDLSTSVSYDPTSPPSFPVADNPNVFIENIAVIDDDLYVTTLVRAGGALAKNGAKLRLPNEIDVQVSADAEANPEQRIHTSCSQPIGVGMVFGPYTITNLTLAK